MPHDELHGAPGSLISVPLPPRAWNLRDPEGAQRNLGHLADSIGTEVLRELSKPLGRFLPRCPDPDMALNSLERFLTNPAGAVKLPALLEGRARTLEILLLLFGTSQYFSDLLVAQPDFIGMLRVPLRRSPSQQEMQEQLQSEVDAVFEDSAVLRAFRQFRQRQILRIGTNDIIRDRPLEEITRDISRVADAALEVALATALRHVSARVGQPFTNAGQPARCVIMAFGKLGGDELNYSSDIDLMFIYDDEGTTRGRRVAFVSNDDFFARVAGEVVRLLTTHTDRGQAYRIDLRLRPEGHRGPLARSLASTLSYYDTLGRTWERQALIKVRPVAGHLELGEQFLGSIESFVYRKYLSFGEINEIKALKRRIERNVGQAGMSDQEVKKGHGGSRDIEFAIQFLQLLNGGDLPEVRQRNTLLAMQALEKVGCLTAQEYQILDDTYRFLRKTEHRLQLMFDLQTHQLPEGEEELRKLARRMGYSSDSEINTVISGIARKEDSSDPGPQSPDSDLMIHTIKTDPGSPKQVEPLAAFLEDYGEKTRLNRKILDHLLHQTFQEEDGQAEPEADLILQPAPDPEIIRSVLGRYPFRDLQAVYNNLNQLATESGS